MTLLRRFALLALLPLALPTFAADPPKKEEPKKKVVVSDPKDVKEDADFAAQGEYEGSIVLNSGEKKVGAQVVAKGGGAFAVKVFMGGLPGAGWDEKTVMETTAKRGEKDVAIDGKGFSGSIGGGKLTIKDGGKIDTTLTKVERKSPTLGEKPPKEATVLFAAAGDEKNWKGGKLVELSDGKCLNNGITSTAEFKSGYKLHVEFRLPWMPDSGGQGRGNSGVYLQDRFELQVLDSFGLKGENNECGGFYTLHKPKVNMCLPPLAWQTYDIEFTPAELDGKKFSKPARATVKHNGVVIQDDVELPRRTDGAEERGNPWAIQFQNHGDPVVYRNVWLVEKK